MIRKFDVAAYIHGKEFAITRTNTCIFLAMISLCLLFQFLNALEMWRETKLLLEKRM